MPRSYHKVLNAQIAGAMAAIFLIVGRWSPERLFGIESLRYFELNRSMLLEPRHWILPILVVTVLLLKFPRRHSVVKPDRVASRYGRSAFRYLVLLFLYLMCSAMWAPVLGLGMLKAYDTFLTFGVLIVIGLWHLSTDAELFHRAFWKSLVILTGILMLCALFSLSTGRLAVLGGGPNVFARLMFLFAAGCMGLSQRRNILSLFPALIAIALVVLSGSRGGMLAAATGILVYIWTERVRFSSKFLLVTGGMAAGVLLLFFTPLGNRVYETFSFRIVELTLQDRYTSERDILVEEAIDIWKEYPIVGTGISGWTALMLRANESNTTHPHNLFCELLCEGGAIAVGLLALVIWKFSQYAIHIRWRLHVPSLACAAMFLVASQFSGDFFDSRGIFICAMLSTFPYSNGTQTIASSAKGTWNSTQVTNSRRLQRSQSVIFEGLPSMNYQQSNRP